MAAATTATALIAGSIDYAFSGPGELITARARGRELVAIANSAGPITQDGGNFDRLEQLYRSFGRVVRAGIQRPDIEPRATGYIEQIIAMNQTLIANGTMRPPGLAEVDRALEKVEESSYGTCDVCGAEIPEGRLEVHPWATKCVTCATP